ncbi:MAG: efflux RND transporter periplasmic adaptor subunit [Dehalococcoidia bacterium]
MKNIKLAIIALLLPSLAFSSLGCGSEAKPTAPAGNQVEVQRGSLTVDILTSGNLQFSKEEELSFDLPASVIGAITVDEVTAEVGDSVEKGDVLATLDQSDWDDKLKDLKLSMMEAESNLKSAQITAEQTTYPKYTQPEIELKELQVEQAKTRLEVAQENLSEFKSSSQRIEAPFSGVVTEVNISAGDEATGETAIKLADPAEFEVEVMVNEMHISKLSIGTGASIQVEAISGLTLPGKVSYIAPTATISSGVVNYQATVKVESLETATQSKQGPGQEAMEQSLPENLPQSPGSNQTMQERPGQSSASNLQLREGLSVTVTIILEKRTDVLLVPSAAITTQGNQSYVQVVTSSGEGETEIETEKRTIQTSISDGTYTEVIQGLSEGEMVVVPERSVPSEQEGESKGIPGMGGMGK